MRKLSRYLIVDFILTFGVAIALITFAMVAGAIYKVVDIMSQGISAGIVGRFFLYNIPYTLSYSVPISALFSTLLLFGRLSSDSELSAMKSGGLSTWQIASPVVLASLVLSVFCLYNNSVVYPATEYANRKLIKGLGVEDPIKLLEEGRFIRDFPGYMIYIGKKRQNKVKDLVVYEVDEDSGKVTSTLRADSGMLSVDEAKTELRIDLYDVRIEMSDAGKADQSRYINARSFPVRVDFGKLTGDKKVDKKRKNMLLSELAYNIRNIDKVYPQLSAEDRSAQKSRYLVNMHQRFCLALAPFTFVLLAVPLGIKTHRKESSIGMIMSLSIMFIYYVFIIIADSLNSKPALYPWLIPWAAILIFQVIGVMLFRRAD